MKILFVVRTLGYGGASKQLALTATALSQRGYSVYLYSYNSNNCMQDLTGVEYIPEQNILESSLKEYIYGPFRIRKIIKKINPDIVISWRANAGCFCRIATWGLNKKVVYCERTDPYMETSMPLKIATTICDFSDGAVFQTEMAQRYYKRLQHRSLVIPNPVNDCNGRKLIPIKERKKEIVCVGRFFLKQKRQDLVIQAFEIIRKRYTDYKLIFYGDGDGIDTIKRMATEKGLLDSVFFPGAIKNVIDKISQSRVLVLSSDYEGIPNIIIESFQAGTPVVSTDCSPGGARVLIDNGVNGFIVPRGNYNELAEKIMKVIDDQELSETFILNARKKITLFAPNEIYDKWDKYLKKHMAGNH